MIIEEISFTSRGIKESAGNPNKPISRAPAQLEYPAGRGKAIAFGQSATAAYQNGWIFNVYQFNNGSYRNLRNIQNSFNAGMLRLKGSSSTSRPKDTKASIFMPLCGINRSLNNRFNNNKISTWDRGGNSVLGMIGPVASDIVSGMMDSITGGINADNNEQIANAGRNTYAGTDPRQLTFSWEITPQNADDLIAISAIYQAFNYFAVGVTRRGMKAVENVSDYIQEKQNKAADVIKNTLNGKDVKTNNSLITTELSKILNNTITVSNPYFWHIYKYDSQDADLLNESYAPCQILNVTLNDPSGEINGFHLAPSMSNKYTLSVTFQELIALTHGGDL